MESDFGELPDQMSELSMQSATLAKDLDGLFDAFQKSAQATDQFSNSLSKDVAKAMRSVIVEGQSLGQSFERLALSMADRAFRSAIEPVADGLAGAVSGFVSGILPFAKGGVLAGGNVQAFAGGGVVNGATAFAMRSGLGVMGEAGPEAIMPLARGADGRLGVEANAASAPVNIVINVETKDAESFRKSQSQITAELSRALRQARQFE